MWEALIWYLKAKIAIDIAFVVFALIMGLVYGVLYVINEEKGDKTKK